MVRYIIFIYFAAIRFTVGGKVCVVKMVQKQSFATKYLLNFIEEKVNFSPLC